MVSKYLSKRRNE